MSRVSPHGDLAYVVYSFTWLWSPGCPRIGRSRELHHDRNASGAPPLPTATSRGIPSWRGGVAGPFFPQRGVSLIRVNNTHQCRARNELICSLTSGRSLPAIASARSSKEGVAVAHPSEVRTCWWCTLSISLLVLACSIAFPNTVQAGQWIRIYGGPQYDWTNSVEADHRWRLRRSGWYVLFWYGRLRRLGIEAGCRRQGNLGKVLWHRRGLLRGPESVQPTADGGYIVAGARGNSRHRRDCPRRGLQA